MGRLCVGDGDPNRCPVREQTVRMRFTTARTMILHPLSEDFFLEDSPELGIGDTASELRQHWHQVLLPCIQKRATRSLEIACLGHPLGQVLEHLAQIQTRADSLSSLFRGG